MEDYLIVALKATYKTIIDTLNDLENIVRKNKLENEQWYINFQDSLNEISVK